MQPTQIIPIEKLQDEKYAAILCYPKYSQEQSSKRIRELMTLGVKAVEFIGEKTAFNIPIIGKGNVGLVVIAHTKTGRAALKIRRVDADREEMKHEADMLVKANSLHVGPRFIDLSENFLLMEFIEGQLLPQWIADLRGNHVKTRIQNVLRDILEQCWRMDQAGLDHGEVTRAAKHIIVDTDDKTYIVDFETASVKRRTSNVTSVCQYLFMQGQLAKMMRLKLDEIDIEALVMVLRKYKHEPSRQNFDGILETCLLTS